MLAQSSHLTTLIVSPIHCLLDQKVYVFCSGLRVLNNGKADCSVFLVVPKVGISWERCFDAAVGGVAEKHVGRLPPPVMHLVIKVFVRLCLGVCVCVCIRVYFFKVDLACIFWPRNLLLAILLAAMVPSCILNNNVGFCCFGGYVEGGHS